MTPLQLRHTNSSMDSNAELHLVMRKRVKNPITLLKTLLTDRFTLNFLTLSHYAQETLSHMFPRGTKVRMKSLYLCFTNQKVITHVNTQQIELCHLQLLARHRTPSHSANDNNKQRPPHDGHGSPNIAHNEQ